MSKNKNIVRYTADDLRAKVASGEDRTDWQQFENAAENMTEVEDADDFEWNWAEAKVVVPLPKEQISLRVDADVLAFFKQGGRGYQTRMNAVLRSYMKAHSR